MSKNRECSDQTARLCMLIWALAVRAEVFVPCASSVMPKAGKGTLRHVPTAKARSNCAILSPLRKYAYSNILKILQFKTKKSDKISDILHTSSQNTDCGHCAHPQSMCFQQNKKNNVYPVNLSL